MISDSVGCKCGISSTSRTLALKYSKAIASWMRSAASAPTMVTPKMTPSFPAITLMKPWVRFALIAQLPLGLASDRHLRVGEHRACVLQVVLRPSLVLVERVVRGQLAFVDGHVHELVAAGDIARRADIRVGGLEILVDLHAPRIGPDARSLQTQAVDVGPAPQREEDLVGFEGHLVGTALRDDALAPTIGFDALDDRRRVQLDAVVLERTSEGLADVGIF